MTRFLDIVFSTLGLLALLPLLLLLIVGGYIDTKSPLFTQSRVGKNRAPFTLIKFRTMRLGTPSVASHLGDASAVTSYGRFLRKSKLDELPQLWNVLCGEMSLVGPRPCLPNQLALIAEREKRNIFRVRPGITGLAQIEGIDMSTPQLLAERDEQMISQFSIATYLRCIAMTLLGHGRGDGMRSLEGKRQRKSQ